MSRTLELPESVYESLVEAARSSGTTPADWIARRLPVPRPAVTEAARAAAMERIRRSIVSLGYPTGTDNEQIDADLIRAYGDSHEPADPDRGRP